MQHGMFYTADVHIYRQIFVCFFLGNQLFVIVGIHITQEIPGRTCPLRHGIGLSLCRAAAGRALAVYPVGDGCQRRFSSTRRLVGFHFRQLQRKLFFRNRNISALRAVYNGNRLAPVTLTGEYPVTQFVIDRLASNPHLLDDVRSFFFQDFGLHTVPVTGIDQHA